jgi:phosphatidylglycerophosphatase A
MNRLALAIATWFGCGYAPKGPGTAGALGALLAALLLSRGAGWSPLEAGVAAAILLLPSIWAAGHVAKMQGGKDPQIVVVDEVVGQWLALAGANAWNWQNVLGAFILFRLFDIWKPAPVRQMERWPGGLGIVADDVMAGIYAALVLHLPTWFNFG